MKARARVVAEPDGQGATRLAVLRSEPPLLLRATLEAVYLVGGAAGPLGGDELRLEIEVAAGASLTVRTAAASVALPGASGAPSQLIVAATVAAGASLRWLPEPSVAAGGCRHRMHALIEAEKGAQVVWREVLVFGRWGESPGSYRSRTDLDLSGWPLLRQELHVGPDAPGWQGPAVTAGARAAGSLLVVDQAWLDHRPAAAVLGEGVGILPLAGPAALVSALAPDTVTLLAALDAGLRFLTGSSSAQPGSESRRDGGSTRPGGRGAPPLGSRCRRRTGERRAERSPCRSWPCC